MGWIKKIKSAFSGDDVSNSASETMSLNALLDLLGIDKNTPREKLSEITYFTCMRMLSESIGKLPLKIMRKTDDSGIDKATTHNLYRMVTIRPNKWQTPSEFWSNVEFHRNHAGNAYVLINGYGKSMSLHLLPMHSIKIWVDNASIWNKKTKVWYVYTNPKTNIEMRFNSDEILHFKTSMSFNGFEGIAVQDILKTTIEGNQKGQTLLNKLYDNGFVGKAVINYTGDLNDESSKKFMANIAKYTRNEQKDIENIIPIPANAKLEVLNSKLADAQFIELKKYSALQIAGAFGIKPNQINDYEKSSYANSESQQLAFLVDTLLYIIKHYEEELSYKLLYEKEIEDGFFFKFNVQSILRADTKTQIETLRSGVQGGIYTPNEARAFLDMKAMPGADELVGNGNLIPIAQVGNEKGGE